MKSATNPAKGCSVSSGGGAGVLLPERFEARLSKSIPARSAASPSPFRNLLDTSFVKQPSRIHDSIRVLMRTGAAVSIPEPAAAGDDAGVPNTWCGEDV